MPTYAKHGNIVTLFLFNHIISRFGVPQSIVIDHGSHFRNQMMEELSAKLGFAMKTIHCIIRKLMVR